MSLRFKILAGMFTVMFLSLVASGVSIYSISKMRATARMLKEEQQKIIRVIESADRKIYRARMRAMLSLSTGEVAQMERALSLIREAEGELKKLLSASKDPRVQKAVAHIEAKIKRLKGLLKSAKENFGSIALSSRQKSMVNSITSEGDGISSNMRKLREALAGELDRNLLSQAHSGAVISRIAVAIMLFNLVVGFIIAMYLSNRVATASSKLVEGLKELAQGRGDLTKRFKVESNDELGEAVMWFNRFMDTLTSMISDIQKASKSVKDMVSTSTAATEELSATVEETSQTTSTIAAAAEELDRTAAELEASAKDVEGKAQDNEEVASDGHAKMKALREQISSMVEEFEVMASRIGELKESAEMVNNVVSVINDIADQTNLLALNAAIEAARAGEHGRGFAVVADEIRKLAEKTTSQTRNIEEIINRITDDIVEYVGVVEKNTQKMEGIASLASETLDALNRVKESSAESRQRINACARAVEEQKIATTHISQGLSEINIAMDEASKAIAELATSMRDILERVEKLQSVVEGFKV